MSDKTYRLKAPIGADECNHDDKRYPVRDGYVDVPFDAVGPLCKVGGFVLIGPTPEPQPTIPAPSAEFVEEVGEALHRIGEHEQARPSPALVAEVVAAIEGNAALQPAPTTN